MALELLTQADYVLNACGRPVPPRGYKFVDLPRIIGYQAQVTALPWWQCPPAPDTTPPYGEFDVYSISDVNLMFTVTNDAETPFQVKVVGEQITLNIPADNTTLSSVLALLNGNPAFAAVAYAVIPAPFNGTEFAKFPVTDVINNVGKPKTGQGRFENLSNTLFLARGIVLKTDPISVRIKWPNGRYWDQFPSGDPTTSTGSSSYVFPQGVGGNMFCFDDDIPIGAGEKVAVETSGVNTGTADIQLWGVLRYLLKDTGNELGTVGDYTCVVGYPQSAKAQGPPACVVGYPVSKSSKGQPGSFMMRDPVEVLKDRPRFNCWPNGNIMAPEFLLGNQCETFTPPGFKDESFTWFSNAVTLTAPDQAFSQSIVVPGQDDLIVRRWRAIITWAAGASGNPVVGLRSPSGYSVTGGDQIPFNFLWWIPMFPTLRVRAGTLLIWDLSFITGAVGTVTVQLEFDGAKRRKA